MAKKLEQPTAPEEDIIDVPFEKVPDTEDYIIDAEIVESRPQSALEGKERKGLPAPEDKFISEVEPEQSAEVVDRRVLEQEIEAKKAEKKTLEQELEDLRGKIELMKSDNEDLFKDAKEVADALDYMKGINPLAGMFDSNYREAKGIVKKILSKPRYKYYKRNPGQIVEKSKQAKSEIFKLEADLEEKDRDYKWRQIYLRVEIERLEKKLASVGGN